MLYVALVSVCRASAVKDPEDGGRSCPGSFSRGHWFKISVWIDMSTWYTVETPGTQPGPFHVPSSDRHTLPSLYRFGFQRISFPARETMSTWGGSWGKVGFAAASNTKNPLA